MLRSPSEMVVHYRETIGDVPPRLIGASITLGGQKLYLFGGSLASASETRLLSALYAFDLELLKWERIKPAPEDSVPNARYFHTADMWNNHLVVFGGLGARGNNAKSEQLQVLNDVRLFNISTRRWLPPARTPGLSPLTLVPRPRHTHLSCISSNRLLIIGGQDFFGERLDDVCVYDLGKKEWIQRQQYAPTLKHAFAATSQWHTRTPLPDAVATGPDGPPLPEPLSYSERVTNKSPSDIYIYSSDHPQRRLDVMSPLPNAEIQLKDSPVGASQPPSLHFPSGGILGNTLILAGNYPSENKDHLFFMWTLDLATNTWSPIDTGDSLKNGSWSTGFLWHSHSKLVVFGNRIGAFVDAANQLVLGWNEVAVVDLQALGIYQPPPLKMDEANQRLGLAALADGRRGDFDFLCEDGRRIHCRRKTIMERWPWFHEQQMRLMRMGDDPSTSIKHGKRTEITVTRTSCSLSQSYPVTMALLQYFYSMVLGTPLQRAPAVLSNLLLISTEFQIPHLQALVRHAMHLALSEATAAGVYEIAASCGCRSLQIRAFSIHANRKKHKDEQVATRPTGRARSNSEGTGLHKQEKRPGAVLPAVSFSPSAFTRPLHAITPNGKVAAPPRTIPPIPSSTLVTRNSDPPVRRPAPREPLPPKKQETRSAASPANGGALTNKYNQLAEEEKQTSAAGNFPGQRKRSQSAGPSRIPRPASRLEQARPASRLEQARSASSLGHPRSARLEHTYPPFKAPGAISSPVRRPEEPPSITTGASKGSKPFARARYSRSAQNLNLVNPQSPTGPREQPTRGRRGGSSVVEKRDE